MDKKYCYRILGLAPGATLAQIKEAYENRIAKLGAPSFDAVVGSENLYEGEAILSYADYLRYLGRFIDEHR